MKENANNIKVGCMGNISPTCQTQNESFGRLDRAREEMLALKRAVVERLEGFLGQQIQRLEGRMRSVQNSSKFSIMEQNFDKLNHTDKMSYQEMTELFNFFSPLVERDARLNSFNFVCTEPNFQATGGRQFEVDSVLQRAQQ